MTYLWKDIGALETSQWFDERESQHKCAVSNKDATNGIAQHIYETSHIINWEKAELIDSHKYQRNRKIKEAIYINAFAPGNGGFGYLMNQDMGTYTQNGEDAAQP